MASSGLITILFTDLVGSTALAQQLGDTAADKLRRDHFDQLRRAVSTTGGTEVKTIGDAMMVSYSSATDAIAGAVAMQQRVHANNGEGGSPAVQMRIGVSAGDATFEEGDWFGTPVVEASRLCDAATGGQILVTDIVRVLAGSRAGHEMVPVADIEGKGLATPMKACEVAWSPVASALGDRIELALPPQVTQDDVFGFVGRNEQRDALLGAWKTTMVSGRLAVFVGGEPGIGKTRLVKELCRTAHREGGTVLWGACDEELALPYQPFLEAFRWLADATPPDVLRELVGALGSELIPLIPDLGQRIPDLEARLSDDPETERHRLFEAATELLHQLSTRSPVVLVLDDLHWARKPTLLLLRHLLKSSLPMQLLIVSTYRDTDLDRTHPLSEMLADMRRQTGVERLMLHGLDEDGVQQFLEGVAGHAMDQRGQDLARVIARETEGNPFFIGEVLRHLGESGALVFRDGRWDSDKTIDDIGIPEGVREVIGRRLSNLDATTNEVLASAAVIGREFELRTLSAVAGGTDRVLDAVGAAETASLVEAVNGRPGVYRFAHALVRSALYDELPTSRRLRLHRDIGHALEQLSDGTTHLTELARHFTEAAALGEVDKAVMYSRRAGEAAISDVAYEEAAAHFERALEALELQEPIDEPLRCHLLMAAGDALHQIADPRGLTLLRAAEASGRERNDMELLANVFNALGTSIFVRGTAEVDPHNVALADFLLARADQLTPALHARVLATYALELFWTDAQHRRVELCDQALAIARELGDRRVLAYVLHSSSYAADVTQIDRLDRAMEEATEIINVAAGIDDALVCNGLCVRAISSVCTGDTAAGERDLHDAALLAERLRIPQLIARTKILRASHALLLGQLDDCDVLLADWEAYNAREGVSNGAAAAGIRYRLQYERGDLADLESLLTDIIAAQPLVPVWRMALCGVYLQTGRAELARPHVEAVTADDFAMVQRNGAFLVTCSAAARVAGMVGALEAAETAYNYAAPFDKTFPFSGVGYEYPVGIGVGCAATALGWYDKAEQHFANSRALCERAGAITYLAATDLHWAEMLVKRNEVGDAARAREFAESALAIADRLGLKYIKARAEHVLSS
ncbi:MAG: AAA family ATPase [Actinomycetia bacterium]|nr:AAA family ATPase [Actinomycetes bacterium]